MLKTRTQVWWVLAVVMLIVGLIIVLFMMLPQRGGQQTMGGGSSEHPASTTDLQITELSLYPKNGEFEKYVEVCLNRNISPTELNGFCIDYTFYFGEDNWQARSIRSGISHLNLSQTCWLETIFKDDKNPPDPDQLRNLSRVDLTLYDSKCQKELHQISFTDISMREKN